MNVNFKISACLVVRNEEKNIARALASIKNVVDEIILVHDGKCEDRTLAIAESFGAKIFIRDFIGVAEPHRPFSYEQAKGEWILQLDADEFLSTELRAKINELVRTKDYNAFEFLWPIYNGQKYITKKWPHKRCLYRKESLSYLGIPNYVAGIKGKICKVDLLLEHKPNYNNYTWKIFNNKWLKWSKIQALTYLSDFNKINKFNYHIKEWPKKIYWRVRWPLILIPVEFLITFLKNMLSGGYKEGYMGWKVSFLVACYRWYMNYYIFLAKRSKL